jgi:hypothetical protein
MATATLTFDLSDPDDAAAHRRAVNATGAYSTLAALDEYIRRGTKHCGPVEWPTAEEIRETLHNYLSDHNVNLNDL